MTENKRTTMADFMNEVFAKNSIMMHLSLFEEAYNFKFSEEFKDRVMGMYEKQWYDYYMKFVESLDLDVHLIKDKEDEEPKPENMYVPKKDVDNALIKTSLLGFITQLIIIEMVRMIEMYQKDE